MADTPTAAEIPKRALFKPAEVCDFAQVQPYVLRSWEAEFPDLGVAKAAGGVRVYRRSDVEQVLRIKHLLLVEGLTLAGVRRRFDEETAPVGEAQLDELIGQDARERLAEVKRGLRSLLELLGPYSSRPAERVAAPTRRAAARRTHRPEVRRVAGRQRSGKRKRSS